MRIIRLVVCVVVAAATAATAIGCGGSSPEADFRHVRYHDLSGGWTALVPAGWTSVVPGPEFVRGQPLADPTRLLLPGKDLVAVITSHLPATVDATAVTRWLLEKYILPAAG